MFIPKENRVATFAYLFKEGVLVVKKDTRSPTHPASTLLCGRIDLVMLLLLLR